MEYFARRRYVYSIEFLGVLYLCKLYFVFGFTISLSVKCETSEMTFGYARFNAFLIFFFVGTVYVSSENHFQILLELQNWYFSWNFVLTYINF